MTGQILCHCVSSDCSKCPMRMTGTSGVRAEIAVRHIEVGKFGGDVEVFEQPQIAHVEWKEKNGIVYAEGILLKGENK